MTTHRFWIVRCLCICFWIGALSGMLRTEAAPRMGLVAAGTGWIVQNQSLGASSDDHLFWTSDDGNNWKDITPRDPASQQIAAAFFLDAAHGWVLLALKHEGPKRQEPDNLITDISGFDVASTIDGGASWTIKRLASLPAGAGWVSAGQIFFLDAAHGWMSIESPVPHWGGAGDLLMTSDGGQTWQLALENTPYGSLRFNDLQNGWMAGGPDDAELYVTRDGGRHWNEVKVPVPRGILDLFKSGPTAGEYGVPLFKDSKRGFLSVTYHEPGAEPGEDMRTLALFSTNDGGFTWHSESWVNLGEDRGILAFTVVDSQALAPKLSAPSGLTLLKLGLAGKSTETEAGTLQLPNTTAISRLDFSDTSHGWASLSDGRLLSTTDGGLTWKDVTPGGRRTSTAASTTGLLSNATAAPLQSTSGAPLTSAVTTASSSITTYKSRHLGFDRCTLPSTSQMSTWWTRSPYFDYGVYVGGVSTNCATVTSSWVNTVIGQGWGLIPIWVGPQAPCSQFASKISTTGGAYAQGQTEADAATKGTKAKMEKLGLGSGSVIYYDIENYDPTATCNGNPTGSYVNSFLAGWVSEIHANGYIAGVYGNTAPASTWYAGGTGYGAVSPSPDDVWIANYNNANSNLTIWGLTSTAGSLPDAAWPQDQRMHQYNGPNSVTWGGTQLNIDNDIEDADVVGGNGAKSYSFSYTTIDYPGAYATFALGINNAGKIVGLYTDLHGIGHGYLDSAGAFTTIDFPGAAQTFASGINNAGSIVGEYFDQQGGYHGFLYQAGSYTSLDYPNATGTQANGINDDNQISGTYRDAASNPHGFQYQAGSFIAIDCPGSTFTGGSGINGDAQIGGSCGTTNQAFVYACWPFPNCANGGTFSYPPLNGGVNEINNNEQIAASTNVFLHEGTADPIVIPGSDSNTVTNLASANDFTMQNSQGVAKVALVGAYAFNGQTSHGFLATSQ